MTISLPKVPLRSAQKTLLCALITVAVFGAGSGATVHAIRSSTASSRRMNWRQNGTQRGVEKEAWHSQNDPKPLSQLPAG
jgi:hypothetical protein